MSGGSGRPVVAPCDHVVQFYARDEQLVSGVAGYLIDAVQAGGVAVIIATAAHRAAFEGQMVAAGLVVESARASGRLVCLDARQTMAEFVVDGLPDADRFRAVVGEVVRRAHGAGRLVHAYGEMVDLLWEAGQVNGAMALEMLWNELRQELPFSLFCAYRTDSICRDDRTESFREICALHSAVIGPASLDRAEAVETERTFPSDLSAPGRARRFMVEALQAWAVEDLIADATVVVSELATNAILHVGSPFTIRLLLLADCVRIGVLDGGSVQPVGRAPALAATSGRGLGLVAALARRWGTEVTENGKLVWAELARPGFPLA